MLNTSATVPTAPSSEPGPVRLAFASALSSHAGTRLTSDIVQNTAPYRDIEDFRFFSVKKEGGTITSVSKTNVSSQEIKDHTDLAVRYYHYNHCDMTRGVNGCLVYAKAKDVAKATPEDKEKESRTVTLSSTPRSWIANLALL